MARESLAVTARFRSAYRRATDALNNLAWLPKLALRLTVGFMFFSGAVVKLGDLGKFTAMFVSLGIPAAQVLAPVTAVVELVGGAALMLGLGTRLVSGAGRGYGRRADHGHRAESGAEVSGSVGFPQQLVLCAGVAAGRAAALAGMCWSRQGQLGRAGRSTVGGGNHRALTCACGVAWGNVDRTESAL